MPRTAERRKNPAPDDYKDKHSAIDARPDDYKDALCANMVSPDSAETAYTILELPAPLPADPNHSERRNRNGDWGRDVLPLGNTLLGGHFIPVRQGSRTILGR